MKRIIKHINKINTTPRVSKFRPQSNNTIPPVETEPVIVTAIEEPIVEDTKIEEVVTEVKKTRKRTTKQIEETNDNNEVLTNE